jgi:hypothetical protein
LASKVIDELGLSELSSAALSEMSGGQRQRVFLGRAVIGSPTLLLLDEPVNFVDSEFEHGFYEKLSEYNKKMAILMVSHDVGTISSHVKSFACVNTSLHYHSSGKITNEQLRSYGCPIQLSNSWRSASYCTTETLIMPEGLFEYSFFVRGLLGAVFASITAGLAGTYIVSRRMVFLSGGITHASFGGIGIGYYLGVSPVAGAALFGILSALGVEYLSNTQKMREDSAIGILWALGMATGIIFIYLTPGYTPNLMSYLFGSILTVTNRSDGSGHYVCHTHSLFRSFLPNLLYISFDEAYARTFSRGM